MTPQYLSVPLEELKEVIFREEALVSFFTKNLDTPPCIHIETTSTRFKQIMFTYVYNEEKQSWCYLNVSDIISLWFITLSLVLKRLKRHYRQVKDSHLPSLAGMRNINH